MKLWQKAGLVKALVSETAVALQQQNIKTYPYVQAARTYCKNSYTAWSRNAKGVKALLRISFSTSIIHSQVPVWSMTKSHRTNLFLFGRKEFTANEIAFQFKNLMHQIMNIKKHQDSKWITKVYISLSLSLSDLWHEPAVTITGRCFVRVGISVVPTLSWFSCELLKYTISCAIFPASDKQHHARAPRQCADHAKAVFPKLPEQSCSFGQISDAPWYKRAKVAHQNFNCTNFTVQLFSRGSGLPLKGISKRSSHSVFAKFRFWNTLI